MYDAAVTILQQKLVAGRGRRARCSSAAALARRCASRSIPTALEQLRPRPRRRPHGARQRQRQSAQGRSLDDETAPGRSAPTTSCFKADEYRPLIVAYRNGARCGLRDVANVDRLASKTFAPPGLSNGKPAVSSSSSASPARTSSRPSIACRGAAAAARRRRSRRRSHLIVVLDRTHDDPRLGSRRRAHAAALHRPGDPGRLPLPAQRPRDAHPERRRAGLARSARSASCTCSATASTTSR